VIVAGWWYEDELRRLEGKGVEGAKLRSLIKERYGNTTINTTTLVFSGRRSWHYLCMARQA